MVDDDPAISRRRAIEGVGVAVSAYVGYASFARDFIEVNVGYDGRTARSSVFDLARTVRREFPFNAATVRIPEGKLADLADRPGIDYVERNGTWTAIRPVSTGVSHTIGRSPDSNGTDQCLPWGVDRTDADVAHDHGDTGEGVAVAIVDTGIDDDHPDLEPNIGEGVAIVGCGDNGCNEPWTDDDGHGTHCAGIVAARDGDEGVTGVAPDATLHAVKVLDGSGRGTFSDIAAGIEAVADKGWDVGSMSLGGSRSRVVAAAVEYARRMGVVLVAAAGNSGPCSDCVGYPAAEDGVIAVSATTAADQLADFSSTGPEIELAAPGKAVYSTVIGGYETHSGTSMACPHVSGAVAQVVSAGADTDSARETLQTTAEDLGLGEDEGGYGFLDVAAALDHDSSDDGTGTC